MDNPLDVVLHPIRTRILMALAGREMTAQQIAEHLGDVPPATLYRHLNRLAEAGVAKVIAERRVRGTVEKVYTLNIYDARVSPDKLAGLSREDHLRYFTTFVAMLLDDFTHYLYSAERVDYLSDGVSYGMFPVELSDEEFAAMAKAWGTIVQRHLKNKPAPGRKRRIVATAVIPDRPAAAQANGSKPARTGLTAKNTTKERE